MIKSVVDTNVFISGTFWRGNCRKILDLASDGKFVSLTCYEILVELEQVLSQDFNVPFDKINEIIRNILSFSKIVSVNTNINVKVRDIKDVKIIHCAISGDADYIVSGDKDLTTLKRISDIGILNPKDFLKKIYY